jgi:hypothetical protein
VVQIAYEPMGWCTYVKTWETALELIEKVDRPNIGLCLDTFHIASLLSHSPETKDGLREGGEAALKDSLEVSTHSLLARGPIGWPACMLTPLCTNCNFLAAPAQDRRQVHLPIPDFGRHLP